MVYIILLVPPLLVAVILHEVAHGYVAQKLGDPTAAKLGRITLNPIKHIDPILTCLVPALFIISGSKYIFGGAKPVPVNPLNFRNPRRHMAYVALAGPAVNFVLAFLSYLACLVMQPLFFDVPPNESIPLILFVFYTWLGNSVLINLILGCFNLLPFPPLDGGRIAVGFLPIEYAKKWARLEPFGLLIVLAILFSGIPELLFGPVLSFIGQKL